MSVMAETEFTFEVWISFGLMVIIFGILGNALTLVSVSYAKSRNKHGFDDTKWISSTVFILNLAFVDLMYCLLTSSMLIYALFLYQKYDVGDTSVICKFYVIGIQNLATIDGWSIALIAFSQAFPRIR